MVVEAAAAAAPNDDGGDGALRIVLGATTFAGDKVGFLCFFRSWLLRLDGGFFHCIASLVFEATTGSICSGGGGGIGGSGGKKSSVVVATAAAGWPMM